MTTYNYKHLYYFWVVAKEGGMSRAAERLGMAVQTISTQVRELERSLGHQLLKPSGRNVVLTHAGETAFAQAEQIFQLGEKLPDVLTAATAAPKVALRVGISDGLPKLAIPRLLGPALGAENLRLECHEDEFEDLLADLALHRLDLILADRPAPPNGNVRVYSHALGSSPIQWFGHTKWAQPWAAAALAEQPAQALTTLPLLLPTTHSAVRNRLNQWMDKQHLQPNVVGEFEDSALLATFAATGMGLFPAPELVRDELTRRLGFVWLGACDGVAEQFYLIGSERKVMHPLVRQVLEAGVVI
jgi:LysR family transcriptional regulator, transcriptional activator of nhaA